MKDILFLFIAVPIFSGILFYGLIGSLIYNKLDKNRQFREKWTGWGGNEFWSDAKKIDDQQLRKYIYTFETTCPKVCAVGFVLTVILAILFYVFVA